MDSAKSMAFWLGLLLCLQLHANDGHADSVRFAVTYTTEPANASLYSSTGSLYGATPLTLYYELPLPWDACVPLERIVTVWISGAEKQVQLSACPEAGPHLQHTVARPQAPGLELDVRFAAKVNHLAQHLETN